MSASKARKIVELYREIEKRDSEIALLRANLELQQKSYEREIVLEVAAERVQIAARIREAWHQREASHGNRAGEYHEGMLAGLDAAVALALGPNVGGEA